MMSQSNTVPEVIARYARNRHRAEFVKANPGVPEEVLAVVYFRRTTNGKWWYVPTSFWLESCTHNVRWWEIPVCPEKIKSISGQTRKKYAALLNAADRVVS